MRRGVIRLLSCVLRATAHLYRLHRQLPRWAGDHDWQGLPCRADRLLIGYLPKGLHGGVGQPLKLPGRSSPSGALWVHNGEPVSKVSTCHYHAGLLPACQILAGSGGKKLGGVRWIALTPLFSSLPSSPPRWRRRSIPQATLLASALRRESPKTSAWQRCLCISPPW